MISAPTHRQACRMNASIVFGPSDTNAPERETQYIFQPPGAVQMPDSCMVSAMIGVQAYFGKLSNPCKAALPEDTRLQASGTQDTPDSRLSFPPRRKRPCPMGLLADPFRAGNPDVAHGLSSADVRRRWEPIIARGSPRQPIWTSAPRPVLSREDHSKEVTDRVARHHGHQHCSAWEICAASATAAPIKCIRMLAGMPRIVIWAVL